MKGNIVGKCHLCGKPVFGKPGVHHFDTPKGKEHIDCGKLIIPEVRKKTIMTLIEIVASQIKKDWLLFDEKQKKEIEKATIDQWRNKG